jgi:TctA family transporter
MGPMIEDNLRIRLIKCNGSLLPLFTQPISAAFAIMLLLVFLYEPISLLVRKVLVRNSKALSIFSLAANRS